MTASITHRGPDDEGYFFADGLGFGFRRLSIIDLSGGHQPMSDREGTVCVIFNGEIYNFKELRRELEGLGHQFQTNSDTEVIVHGYKQWGTDFLGRLNGMFGLAVWDVNNERLLVARDAMGIKPVYFRDEDGVLSFGSEIRAVLAADEARPDLDPLAVRQFLQFRYTPAPLTIFKGIRKLAPGTMLIAERGHCRESRWYDFTPEPFAGPKEDGEAKAELLELYRKAVERHLLSDVPVGILLSGGLDSGLLLGLMNEYGKDWPAYTVGYGSDFRDDELADAAETARLLGAKHISVRIDQGEFEKALPGIVRFLEEPIASSSIVPMYFVCERARMDVKVALIGQGPDELFGGYNRHLGVRYGHGWRALPRGLQGAIASAMRWLPRNETIKRGVQSLGVRDRIERYQAVFSLAPESTVKRLFRDGVFAPSNGSEIVPYWSSLEPQMERLDELGGFQMLEIRSSLPDELLMFGDKLSMAHGLEVRVPYLDRTVVEFAQRLDSGMKIRWGKRKWLHREVCRSYLPTRVLRRKKRGFAVNVVDDWFRSSMEGALPQMLLEKDSIMFQLLDPHAVKGMVEQHRASEEDHHKLLFSLVMLEQLLRVARDDHQLTQTASVC